MAKKNAAGQRPGTAAGRASKQDPQRIAQELSETAANTVRDAVHAAQTVGGDVTRLARQAGAGAVQAADLLRAATARLARSVADAAEKPTPGGNATTRAKRTARPAQARRKRSS
jgi:hypothetical protein